MARTNPYAADPEPAHAAWWEQGYGDGYVEPEIDHAPPLSEDLLPYYQEGEQEGRNDRRDEPPDPLPPPGTEQTRFESAPDGALIPIPSEAPQGNLIREDAQIQVSPRTDNGYYVSIFNGPPEGAGEAGDVARDVAVEAVQEAVEDFLKKGATAGARAVISFGGILVGILIDATFFPTPTYKQTFMLAALEDGTPVKYVVIEPQ